MKWERKSISDICTLITSGGTPLTSMTSFYEPKEIPWLKTSEVNYCRIFDTENYISKEGLARSSAKMIPANSVIVAMYGQGDTAGRVAINKIPLSTNQACCNLIIDDNVADYNFVYYSLCTLYDYLVSQKTGGAQPNLNAKKIKQLQIPLPPLTTQRRIASILSAYDDLIENNRRQIKLLEEAAQRLYKEWFVDFRFPGHENVRIVDGVPEGWEYRKLGEVANITMGQSPKSEFYNKKKEGLPFHQGVGSYGERFVKDEIYSSSYNRIATNESILFSVRAPVGRLNITKNKIAIGRGLSAINHKKLLQSFLFYSLKYKFFKDNLIGNGAIFSSITKEDLASQDIIIPNKDIDCKYNTIIQISDLKIKNLDEQVLKLTEARDRLLPKLMSGEIEV